MEPQLPKPQFSPEGTSAERPSFRSAEGFTSPKFPELSAPVEQGKETRETFHDGPKGDPAGTQPIVTPPPLPVIDPQAGQTTTGTDDSSNPAVAADEDLIEKEWVEKAKKVVAETRNDPYAQDIAVSRLQADYLKKRYGKDIALPTER